MTLAEMSSPSIVQPQPGKGIRAIMTRIFTRAFVVLLILAAVSPSARAPGVGRPEVAHSPLDNGRESGVLPDHRAPVVTHMAWSKVRSADETPGKSGLAHFLE